VTWELFYSRQAAKDSEKITAAGLKPKVEKLLLVLKENPFANPPPYEKLRGDLIGHFARRINIQHRLVYKVDKERKIVDVLTLWTHYE
jgi:Txe/YoeB family toxin of toxin-antitoxin system